MTDSLYAPETFFNLKNFKHRSIYAGLLYAWEALEKIDPYLKSQNLGKIEVEVPKGVTLIHPELISIGKGSSIEVGSWIQGPCIIGEHCSIRQGAYIRGAVITGNNCVIGHASEVKSSIIADSSKLPHFAYVGNSLLGTGVNLGAGVRCANLKLNRERICVNGIDSGLRKFGAILGDYSQIGCNAVLNPGSVIGKKVICYPLKSVRGYVEEGQVVI